MVGTTISLVQSQIWPGLIEDPDMPFQGLRTVMAWWVLHTYAMLWATFHRWVCVGGLHTYVRSYVHVCTVVGTLDDHLVRTSPLGFILHQRFLRLYARMCFHWWRWLFCPWSVWFILKLWAMCIKWSGSSPLPHSIYSYWKRVLSVSYYLKRVPSVSYYCKRHMLFQGIAHVLYLQWLAKIPLARNCLNSICTYVRTYKWLPLCLIRLSCHLSIHYTNVYTTPHSLHAASTLPSFSSFQAFSKSSPAICSFALTSSNFPP